MRVAYELFIHQIFEFSRWLATRPGNRITHLTAVNPNDPDPEQSKIQFSMQVRPPGICDCLLRQPMR